MKRFFKWFGVVFAVLIAILAVVTWVIAGRSDRELSEHFSFNFEDVTIPTDSASVARGQHVSSVCWSCHGTDFSGRTFFDNPNIGTITAANLTGGKGGIGRSYTDKDWVRSIRHGVAPDGRGLFIMPSNDFFNFSKRDLSCLVAFLKTLPPVDKELTRLTFAFSGKILYGLGAFGNQLHAKDIDHSAKMIEDVPESVSAEYGNYITRFCGCRSCHGLDFAGFKEPNPDSPLAPNITPRGNPGKWTEEQFLQVLRSGETPEGKHLNSEFMPWQEFAQFTDAELKAVFMFLKSLPPKENSLK